MRNIVFAAALLAPSLVGCVNDPLGRNAVVMSENCRLFRTGCYFPSDVDKVAAATTASYDRHMAVWRVKGPSVSFRQPGDGLLAPHRHKYRLRASAVKSEIDRVQLYVSANFPGWAFLDRAFAEGRELDFTRIARMARGYSVIEDFAITLQIDRLRELAKGAPFEFKAAGQQGSLIVTVPPGYFAGFAKALVRLEAQR